MSEEIVDVVDEHNKVVDQLPRHRVRGENLRHRATYIFVFLGEKKESKLHEQLVVQKRTAIKDYCPSHWDVCTGGVVAAGEEYTLSAERELDEEIGLKDIPLHHLYNFLYEDTKTKVWGGAYECRYSGSITDLKLQESEVAAVEVMTIVEVLEHCKTEPYTPDSMLCLQLYLDSN